MNPGSDPGSKSNYMECTVVIPPPYHDNYPEILYESTRQAKKLNNWLGDPI
jgi:hypothetical protein